MSLPRHTIILMPIVQMIKLVSKRPSDTREQETLVSPWFCLHLIVDTSLPGNNDAVELWIL